VRNSVIRYHLQSIIIICNACCRRESDESDSSSSSDGGEHARGDKVLVRLRTCRDALLKRLSEAQMVSLRSAVVCGRSSDPSNLGGGGFVGDCVHVECGPRRGLVVQGSILEDASIFQNRSWNHR
jgi:hypothetical protein